MKSKINVLALVLGFAPGFAFAQAVAPTTPPTFPTDQQQRTDRDSTMQDQHDNQDQIRGSRDDQNQIRHDQDEQQRRSDQDYDRGSRRDAGNLNDTLHQRFPNTDISASFQDNHTVVLTGTAATGHDRRDAVNFVQSQVGNARVVDQIQVTGYGRDGNSNRRYDNGYPTATYPRTDRDRDRDNDQARPDDRNSGYNSQERDQHVDRDSRMPQSDVDSHDRDQYGDKDKNRDHYSDKDKHKSEDRDKGKDKDKDKQKDKDRDNRDNDQVPH